MIRDYPGNYTQYRILEKSKQNLASVSSDITTPKEFTISKKETVIAQDPVAVNNKKGIEKMTFKEKHELDNLNKSIPEMESKKVLLSEKLNDASLDYNAIIQLSEELGTLNQTLEAAELRWLTLNEKQ